MKQWSIAFLSIWVLFGMSAFADNTGKIAGNVRDKNTKEPLIGATVVVEGTKLGAGTDANGYYFILNVPVGVYKLTTSFIGYSKVSITEVRVNIGQTTEINFDLPDNSLQIQDIVVVAEKPKVELDQTGSKSRISGADIANSWGKDLTDIVSDDASSNIHGGIRGSFGGDVAYRMDGLDLRDGGSNTNFSSVNMSTIQEVEVLKGGWNAEYGQANGSIVNIVTKKATDRIHVVGTYKVRPPGQYHWGRNIYDKNDIFHTLMTTSDYWDTSKTWRTPYMSPSDVSQKGNPVPKAFIDAFHKAGYADADIPQAMGNWWKSFVNDSKRFPQFDYANRTEYEGEATFYGPIIENLSFLASGRYKQGVNIYPSALKYNPDMTFQGALEYVLPDNSMISFNGMFTKFDNSGDPRTNYQSSETNVNDIASQALPYISDPYDKFKYWLYGPSNNGSSAGNAGNTTIRPPEHAQMANFQTKIKKTFGASTFLDAALQYSQVKYNLDFRDIAQTANPFIAGRYNGLPSQSDTLFLYGIAVPGFGNPPTSTIYGTERWGSPGDIWRSESNTKTFSFKTDVTSQINKANLVQGGIIFSYYDIKTLTHEGNDISAQTPYAQVNDIVGIKNRPYEGAAYLQDKIEIGGMVLNAGLRFDCYNANKKIAANFYDPLMISQYTTGNSGKTGLVGYRQDGSGPGYTKTPLRYAFSPRIGISHPITETTVLHFMYGVFNQRPAWVKLLANPVVWTDNRTVGNFDDLLAAGKINADYNIPDTTLVTYRYYGAKTGNPALEFEKVTQFEVGLEQNIANLFSLNVTMYYKEGENLTSLGINSGPDASLSTSSGAGVEVRLYGEPTTFTNSDNRVPGQYIGNFTTDVNGAWANVRGLEAILKSKFRYINFELNYTMSNLSTGRYYDSKIYTNNYLTGQHLADNTFAGPNNTDGGGVGVDDQTWNPHNSANLKLSVLSPNDFGPEFMDFYPLADWVIASSTRWVQGQTFTWYPTDYTGIQIPNNRRWFDRWNTNLNLSRSFALRENMKLKLFVQVTNLFNTMDLRLFTNATASKDLDNYMTYKTLPYQATTKEPTVWNYYTNLPRQMYFGATLEF